jgi:hypothetical protein
MPADLQSSNSFCHRPEPATQTNKIKGTGPFEIKTRVYKIEENFKNQTNK